MVRALEKFHSYKVCPKCHAEVASHHRFCRNCTFWLAQPDIEGLRPIDGQREYFAGNRMLQEVAKLLRDFRSSIHFIVIGASMGVIGTMALFLILHLVVPDWKMYLPRAEQRACYSNMRVIQGALELYLQEHRFTPALASDPAGVLLQEGFLNNRPQCPIKGNRYVIPPGSGLQCVGSEGHGLPY